MENKEIKYAASKLAKKYDLNLLLIFGSRVKIKLLHRESDFDIAYLSKRELSGQEMVDLNCDLIDIFHCDKIDLVDIKKAKPFLSYEIAQNCQLIFGAEKNLLEFKAAAFKKYIDYLPLLKLRDFLIEKRQDLLKKIIYAQ